MTDDQRQRIHDIEYSCDSREELAERIVVLEDELATWERLTAGIELPEYPITEFQPKDLERENTRLREENAKLVDVLHEVEEEAVLAYHGLQSDIELLIKSETEFFEKWWHSECRNDNKLKRIEVLDAENAKLRELAKTALGCVNRHVSCNECRIVCCGCTLQSAMRELGIEVQR